MKHIILLGRGHIRRGNKILHTYCSKYGHKIPFEDKTLNQHGGQIIAPIVRRAPVKKRMVSL